VIPLNPSMRYGFVRGRQLDGTFPGDKQTGVWPITHYRIKYGWGAPPEEAWPYGDSSIWPPIEPSGIDDIARKFPGPPYKRVRTLEACAAILKMGEYPSVSLSISSKWANPPGGVIPIPDPKDIITGTHYVTLFEYDAPNRVFKFRNSWGPAWGDEGCGYIGHDVLEATWWEGWLNLPPPPPSIKAELISPLMRKWKIRVEEGRTLHWYEVADETGGRLAWASALELGSGLEIEELFVCPQFRRNGLGRSLFSKIHKLSLDRALHLCVWISFADASSENLAIIERIVAPVGLSIQSSGVRWAPLVAWPIVCKRKIPIPQYEYPAFPPSCPSSLLRVVEEVTTAAVATPQRAGICSFVRDLV